MALTIDRFKNITVNQGGADAFVEANVDTLLVPENGLAWLITYVELLFLPGMFSGISADASVYWSMTRDTKAAVPSFGDPDSIWVDGFDWTLTTSGSAIVPSTWRWTPPQGIIFVEPTIYFQLDSTATGATLNARVRIHYEEIKVSEVDILRMLNNS